MTDSCSSEGASTTNAMECVSHCLSAARAAQGIVTPVVAGLVQLLVVLMTHASARHVGRVFVGRRDDFIGKFVLHQQLSTIVLRN